MMAVAIIAAEEVAETVVAGLQLLVVKVAKWLQASGIIGYN